MVLPDAPQSKVSVPTMSPATSVITSYSIHYTKLYELDLWVETGDASYRGVIDEALTYLDEDALRDAHGGINHMGDTDVFGIATENEIDFPVGFDIVIVARDFATQVKSDYISSFLRKNAVKEMNKSKV